MPRAKKDPVYTLPPVFKGAKDFTGSSRGYRDVHGHGTHVSGTIAGTDPRIGVAAGFPIYHGKGLGDSGSGGSSLYRAIDYCLEQGCEVISNSWGTSGSHFAPFDPISIASKRAYDAGIVVTFAAGNDGPGPDTLNPYSASPCVISVAAGAAKDTTGATNPLISAGLPGQLADFSSRGVPGDSVHHPDITLPGVAIVAARATTATIAHPYLGLDGLHPEPLYAALDGTSMATPHLSGVVALMLEVNPKLNLDGVLSALRSTARPIWVEDAATGATRQLAEWEAGAGYADAYGAVRAAASTAGTRYSTVTTALPGWSGNVDLALSVPVADVTLSEAAHEHALSVPAGTHALRVRTDWGNPAYDLDMSVYDPSGNLVGKSANGTSTGEAVSIPRPVAGTWRVVLKGYLNAPTAYTGTAEVDTLTPVSQ